MRRTLVALSIVATASLVVRGVDAGDPPKPPAGTKPAERPAEPADKDVEWKGTEVRWVVQSLTDAIEEAAQRNVLLYVHSHGST